MTSWPGEFYQNESIFFLHFSFSGFDESLLTPLDGGLDRYFGSVYSR